MAVRMDFGPLSPADLDAAAALVRQGFGIPRENFERSIALFGTDVLRGLRRDGQLVGCAAVWPMDQWFGGRPVPAHGVAAVAVDPAARGRGHGSALVRGVLEEARASGAALSVLYPATLALYARAGYGRGGVSFDWSAPPAALLDGPPPGDGTVMRAAPRDATPLAALRRRVLETGNGLVERNEGLWSFALCPDGEPSDLFLLNGPDGPEGYVAVGAPKRRSLVVADICLLSRRAAKLALGFLAGYRAQVDRLRWRGGPDDPLALLAPAPAAAGGVAVDAREEWLLRILDVERALSTRGYPAALTAELLLDVADPLFPANGGLFRLFVSGGRGGVQRVSGPVTLPPAGVLSLDVAALATLYSGHRGAALLRQVGLLEGGDDAVATASLVFAGPSPWMPDRF
ncbi:GNAT family N-acetyltransferase [Azospirillum rugosum]|uniref:Acetyltransferase n=1 Tax=Azospirillum rugosum TaxID=416170 RepID=A0ABS4SHX3_9PROT|nr:GNAT family N-acetyltransferase [Azospirillum rugosum]MBP2292168.1 putative acetyltransferase [Azospirillum rugosum]MDQ0525696.1 putative acetyltransferase [Azospirillum rugosum]